MGKPPKKPTFEQAIAELETIVQAMEEGNLTLRKKLQVLKPDGTLAAQEGTDDVPF